MGQYHQTHVGDHVRINHDALFDEFREVNTSYIERKRLVVLFTVDIYQIHRVRRPKRIDVSNEVFQNNVLNNTTYSIISNDNQILATDTVNIQIFIKINYCLFHPIL